MGKLRKNAIRDESNFDGRNLSIDIVQNRRKIAIKMAKKYDITPEILAEYFQVPLKTITKDIEEANIQFVGNRTFKINKEKNVMKNVVLRKIEEGIDKQDALASVGMWGETVLFGEKIEVSMRGLNMDSLVRMQKALDLCAYGYSQTDIVKMTKITIVERELVKSQLEENMSFTKGLGGGTSLVGTTEFAKDRFQKGEDSKDINKATGVPVAFLEKTNYDTYKNKYSSQYQRKDGKDTQSYKEKDKIKEEIYQRWTNRECTQQELADELGVTRITIMNWCREMKAKHMSERPEMAIRQRNIKRELKEQRDVQKEKAISSYLLHIENGEKHSDAVYKVASELKIGYNKALDFLREDGVAPTGLERYPNSENTKKEDIYFKEGYDKGVMAHFGYGPNAGKSGYEVDEYGNASIRNEYQEVVSGQRQVSYEIKNEPAFTTHIRNNDGVIGNYWKNKKEENRISNKIFGNVSEDKTNQKEDDAKEDILKE